MRRSLLLSVWLAAACSPPPQSGALDAGSPETDAGPRERDAGEDAGPTAASDYCEVTVEAYCGFYLRCGRMAADDLTSCRSTFLESCNGRYERLYATLADAGMLTLSRAGIDACAAHLSQVECSAQVQDLDGPCGLMWVGQQPVGAPCGLGIESLVCAPGASCVVGLDFCGTCRAVVGEGEPCGGDVTCGAAGSCVDGACANRAQVGESCDAEVRCVLGASCINGVCAGPTYVAVGEACGQARRCPYASHCSGGVCVRSSLLDEACASSAECATGFCNAAGRCEPLKDQGAACSAAAECVTGICADGQCGVTPGACFNE